MRFSVVTPNYNGAKFLEKTIRSVIAQKEDVELEYILIDGGSQDNSIEIIDKYRHEFSHCVVEKDNGPANAINKGFALASGDIVSWLNSDDVYFPGTLARVREAILNEADCSMCFGNCLIVDQSDKEIRSGISTFKKLFFPLSCRFTYQCINYISQPALFFKKQAMDRAGKLREDMVAAWDYEFILRMWHYGGAKTIVGSPLAAFRWYEQSISGQNFEVQFKEEYEVAKKDAGRFSPQTMIHFIVRWGIVAIYSALTKTKS